jgi:hypothetical protein
MSPMITREKRRQQTASLQYRSSVNYTLVGKQVQAYEDEEFQYALFKKNDSV